MPASRQVVITAIAGVLLGGCLSFCSMSPLLLRMTREPRGCELIAAIHADDEERIEQLIRDGDARMPCVDDGLVAGYPLHAAARMGNSYIAEWIINSGADPDCRDVRGTTPIMELMWASAAGDPRNGERLECLDVLVRHGADVNATDTSGGSALRAAAAMTNAAGARRLLEHGAEVEPQALHIAAGEYNERGLGVVEVLLEYGVDVNALDADGKRAVDLAREHGNTEIVQLLESNP